MALTAAAIRLMAAKGMSAEDIADIAEAMEAPIPMLSPGAIRTRQWRTRLEATGQTPEEWRVTSMRVIARDGGVCQYCGTTKGRMACDHVTPLSQGGSSGDDNLVCACHACNGGKSGNTLEHWMGEAKATEWRYHRETSRDIPHVGEPARVVIPSLPSLRSEEVEEPPVKPKGLTAPRGAETARGCRLPEDWLPVANYDASDFGLSHEQHADELAKFLDYWRSVPGAKGRKTDWPATWRNWMRRASENSARKAHERPHHDAKFNARQANLARALAGADSAAGRHWKP